MRVGIYRTCGIGDAVQLTPLLQQIRADLPAAELVMFTSENAAPILRECPALDRCVSFPLAAITGAAARLGGLPLWSSIRAEGAWDYFLNFEPQYRRSLAFPLVRARRSTGFITPGRKPLRLYTHPIHVPAIAPPDAPHISQYYLDAWSRLTGFADRGFGYDVRYLLAARIALPELPHSFLCLAPGSGNFANMVETKRWPYWMDLAELLREAGWSLVWLGDGNDARSHRPPPGDTDLLGRIDLVTAAQVLHRSAGVVGNDSGMFHLALGLDVKAAAFYGPTSSTHVGPFRTHRALVLKKELPCVPCQEPTCRVPASLVPEGRVRPFCMTLQRAGDVLPALHSFLAAPAPAAAL